VLCTGRFGRSGVDLHYDGAEHTDTPMGERISSDRLAVDCAEPNCLAESRVLACRYDPWLSNLLSDASRDFLH
jgi:hypothetical protein